MLKQVQHDIPCFFKTWRLHIIIYFCKNYSFDYAEGH